ncbi:MAG: hypothetical protein QM728_11605 [Gordonia sp. (in: high G+C Gram-positive bacteria)]|uniref:SCO4848 family membrane protein n=1 Tax=Gordonia sp. (in: high G+C Gram-positive bacteria) TaxID=84139 RepID=UPI0039E55398
MTVFAAVLLLINAIYNVVVWPRFWKRVTDDPRARDEAGAKTTFYTVHLVLVSVALLIAIVSAIAGVGLLVSG